MSENVATNASTDAQTHYNFTVFIGRFQPLHDAHVAVMREALRCSDKLILLIGSASSARSVRNPFTFAERSEMIRAVFPGHEQRILIEPLEDISYNDQLWIERVQSLVHKAILHNVNPSDHVTLHGTADYKIALIGHNKDNSSYYLKMFPSWDSINVAPQRTLAATVIREEYFRNPISIMRAEVPPPVKQYLQDFYYDNGEIWKSLAAEYVAVKDYKAMWENAPFTPIFVTVDAVVIQSGHVLLITRGGYPGKGLMAFPGGFIDADETLEQSVIRELREETEIADHIGKIPPAKLRSFIMKSKVYDNPHRSPRGRTITHAFLFMLPASTSLYPVVGSDDATAAHWVPLSEVRPELMNEDHFAILRDLVGQAS